MSFIKKIKRKDGKAYAIEVEGYRDKQGKVRPRYLRYVGAIDKEGNILPSNKEINVDNVYHFGFPFVISQTVNYYRQRRWF